MTEGGTEKESAFPVAGRIAAIDFGSVRIGVAVCDPERILASPLEVHPATNWQANGDYYRKLARQERLVGFIVGLPIHLDGGESEKSGESRHFANWLAEETKLPVRLFDERFTTADAKGRLAAAGYTNRGKKKRIDAVAAWVLLESFIEACRYRQQIVGQPATDPPSKEDDIG